MRPDPSIVARLLALPIEVRRRLAEQPGPGWWVAPSGRSAALYGTPTENYEPALMLAQGWAWYPADSAAWMRATGCGDWSIDCQDGEVQVVIVDETRPQADWHRGATAEECALSWFEAALG